MFLGFFGYIKLAGVKATNWINHSNPSGNCSLSEIAAVGSLQPMRSEVRRPRVWKGDLTCSASTCSDGSLAAARANIGWLSLSPGEGQHPCQHLDM